VTANLIYCSEPKIEKNKQKEQKQKPIFSSEDMVWVKVREVKNLTVITIIITSLFAPSAEH